MQQDGVLRAQFTDIDEKERGNSVSPGASSHEHGKYIHLRLSKNILGIVKLVY